MTDIMVVLYDEPRRIDDISHAVGTLLKAGLGQTIDYSDDAWGRVELNETKLHGNRRNERICSGELLATVAELKDTLPMDYLITLHGIERNLDAFAAIHRTLVTLKSPAAEEYLKATGSVSVIS